jgi:hypothetical protein
MLVPTGQLQPVLYIKPKLNLSNSSNSVSLYSDKILLHSCFVFRRSWAQISVQTSAILTEVFHGLPQSLLVNAQIVP